MGNQRIGWYDEWRLSRQIKDRLKAAIREAEMQKFLSTEVEKVDEDAELG